MNELCLSGGNDRIKNVVLLMMGTLLLSRGVLLYSYVKHISLTPHFLGHTKVCHYVSPGNLLYKHVCVLHYTKLFYMILR